MQRKRAANAPLHRKRLMASSHVAPELHDKAKGRMPRAIPVRKGDTVRVMRGGFEGREGKVVSVDRVYGTVVVEREYLRYIRKYERYEKRTHRMNVHAPPCLGLQVGNRITMMECRPLGKTVHFVAIHNQAVAA
ncbi:MAG: 50S ribosomal protein L24 [Methanobacteriota archaeon]|nr:MAG: 50S ribosomal protein L24 [Euryarchaeota archaeon]